MAHITGNRRLQAVSESGWKRTDADRRYRDRTGRRHCIFSDGCRNPSYGRRKYPYYDRTDTDVTPFDTGAYASKQSFVTGTAVKQCAEKLYDKIIAYAKTLLPEQETRELSMDHGWIYAGDEAAMSLEAVAQESYYSLTNSSVLTAEVSTQVKKNTLASGLLVFAEVEVDMKLGTVKILRIINVHDSGKLLNPQLAEMQVHGGMSMGMGYGVSEQLILDEKTGRLLNGNLLDYKLMTALDTPDIKADFV